MALYDFRCPKCNNVVEVEHPMQAPARVYKCSKCHIAMVRIYEFPHVELNWKAYDRNETGSSRMVLRAAKPGKTSRLDDSTERGAIVHDDHRQEGKYG